MTETQPKPRVRVKAGSAYTADSFANMNQRLGLGTGGALDGSGYMFNAITRNRVLLEAAYRGSWIIRQAVDAPAEDMTRAGISIQSALDSKAEKNIMDAYRDLAIGEKLSEGISWGRLYGGAINFMMIDGQKPETPLDVKTIGKGQFKGLLPLDRWVAQPESGAVIQEFGPNIGLPEFYVVQSNAQQGLKQMRIHHSRVVRHIGAKLPFWQRQIEMLWGESILEPVWDRVLAFDSTTMGAAQLVFKAHLRTMKIEKYRELIATGGKMFEAVAAQLDHIRQFQNAEGLTVIDSTDAFETHSYAFSGLDNVLREMGDQVCGAVEIPRVRLFGETPGGLNTDGDSALKTYYDTVKKKQESQLRSPTTTIMDVLVRSVTGAPPPEDFSFAFNPLWQMSDEQKGKIAKDNVEAIGGAYDAGLITQKVGMEELRKTSEVTGMFGHITDEDIKAAEDVIPDPLETAAAMAEIGAENEPSKEAA